MPSFVSLFTAETDFSRALAEIDAANDQVYGRTAKLNDRLTKIIERGDPVAARKRALDAELKLIEKSATDAPALAAKAELARVKAVTDAERDIAAIRRNGTNAAANDLRRLKEPIANIAQVANGMSSAFGGATSQVGALASGLVGSFAAGGVVALAIAGTGALVSTLASRFGEAREAAKKAAEEAADKWEKAKQKVLDVNAALTEQARIQGITLRGESVATVAAQSNVATAEANVGTNAANLAQARRDQAEAQVALDQLKRQGQSAKGAEFTATAAGSAASALDKATQEVTRLEKESKGLADALAQARERAEWQAAQGGEAVKGFGADGGVLLGNLGLGPAPAYREPKKAGERRTYFREPDMGTGLGNLTILGEGLLLPADEWGNTLPTQSLGGLTGTGGPSGVEKFLGIGKAAELAMQDKDQKLEIEKAGQMLGAGLGTGIAGFFKTKDPMDLIGPFINGAVSLLATVLFPAEGAAGGLFSGLFGGLFRDGGSTGLPEARMGRGWNTADGKFAVVHDQEYTLSAPAVSSLGGLAQVDRLNRAARNGGAAGGGNVTIHAPISAVTPQQVLDMFREILGPALSRYMSDGQAGLLAGHLRTATATPRAY
jgi:hypothetical protein